MKTIFTHPTRAALISLLLSLPFIYFILHFMTGKEPNLGPLTSFLSTVDSRLGSMIVFAAFALSLAGFFLNLMLIRRTSQGGKGMLTLPINLFVMVLTLYFILWFIGSIIVDQYPCWIGVPNCD